MSVNQIPLTSAFLASERNRSRRPRTRATAQDNDEATSLGKQTGVRRRRVLVVDDDPIIRSTLTEALRDWGYQPREAATLRETLAIVSRERPAAVLLDVRMPDGSGISILDELKRRSPDTVFIIITGYVTNKMAFEAGARHAYGFLTKPIDEIEVRSMLEEALAGAQLAESRKQDSISARGSMSPYETETKRGRPQHQTTAPLGQLILKAMKLLGLSYKDIVSESERLARLNNNSDMRIGKSTLGNIISGSIRQPGTAKLDALRISLNLSRAEIDAALGLQPERRFAGHLEMTRARTHEVSFDAVTRQRKIRIPVLRDEASLNDSQFFEAMLKAWATVDVEYLSSFYPPYYCYVVVGEEDNNASPVAPPGSRLLVNKLLNKIHSTENISYHERELFYVITPRGFTCAYLENAPGEKIVLVPHPESGNVREVFRRSEITIIGQVVGVLYPR